MKFINLIFCILFPCFLYSADNNQCTGHAIFLGELYANVGTIISSDKMDEEKMESIKEIILQNIDIKRMARFVLSNHWKKLAKEEREQFIAEYSNYITNKYAYFINEYFSKMETLNTSSMRKGECVTGMRLMYKDEPYYISCFTVQRERNIYIYDVTLERISTAITDRAEFYSILKTAGINGLINKLRENQ